VVGAIACLGIVLVEPLVRRAWGSRAHLPRNPTARRTAGLVALQVGAVAVIARVAGLETSAKTAAAISIATLLAAAAGVAVVLAPRRGAGRGASTSTRQSDAHRGEREGGRAPTP
jgi:hypothetical protein